MFSRMLNAALVLAAVSLAPAAAVDQADNLSAETVSWTATPAEAKAGGKLVLTLNGSVTQGWHIYSLQQLPLGPNPLRVTVDSKDLASVDGTPSESKAIKARDAAFGFETQYFDKAFTVSLPVRLAKSVSPGEQIIAVSVRFQTCNGRVCQPPKSVHLSVPVTVKG